MPIFPIPPLTKGKEYDLRVEVVSHCKEYVFFGYSESGKSWLMLCKYLGRWGNNSVIFPWYVGALLYAHARDCGLSVEFIPPGEPDNIPWFRVDR